jgi:tRNA-dihydrouridine synthase A
MRLLTTKATLYTEMLHENAIVHTSNREELFGFNECEHPVVLQIGGSDPQQLVKAAKIVEEFKYDEINLNVGCPSKTVQRGSFGACLMKKPELVS